MNENRKPSGGFANFWEYHKIPIIVAVIAAALLIFFLVRGSSNPAPDADLLYIGPKSFTVAQIDSVNAAMTEKIITADHNSDGKIVSDLMSLVTKIKGVDEDGETVFDPAFMEEFRLEMQSGDTVIFIVENEALYDSLMIDDLLMPLEEIFGETPENAADPFSFRFGDLDLCKLDALDCFSKNARLCVRYPRVVNGVASDQAKKLTEYNLKVFRDMIAYSFRLSDNK